MKPDLDENGTNVNGGVESNVNIGFGSKTVGSFSPPRVENLISDRDEFALTDPVMRNKSKTDEEIPPSKLALVLSPPPLHFVETDEGDIAHDGGTRSALSNHVRIRDPSRTPSPARSLSRSGVGNFFTPRSHSSLSRVSVAVDVADAMDGANPRTPDRRYSGLRDDSDEEGRIDSLFSPTNVRSRIDDDGQHELRRELPNAAAAGMRVDHQRNPSTVSTPSNSQKRSCSPTARSLSPRTEVLSVSRFSMGRCDKDIASAFRRGMRSDRLNEIVAGKEACVGRRGNEMGGVEDMGGCCSSRLSVVTDDGSEDGREELCCPGVSQDLDARSRCSSPSYFASGSCADARVDSGTRCLPAGSYPTVLPGSRYPSSSYRWSTFGTRHGQHATGRLMDDKLSPNPYSRFRDFHRTPIPGSLKAAAPAHLSRPIEAASFTYDAGASRDNTQLNTHTNASWSIQTKEHVHPDTQDFDTLRFSSSSPSVLMPATSISAPRNLHLDGSDDDKDGYVEGSRPGFNERFTFNGELRTDMKDNMMPNPNMGTVLSGGADGAVLSRDSLGYLPASKVINNRYDGGGILRHVEGIQHRDMGGFDSDNVGPFGLRGRASQIPGSLIVAGVSGVSAAGSLFRRALRTGAGFYDEDVEIRLPIDFGVKTPAIQPRSIDRHGGGEGEGRECGLLESLLESSDPWGLMRRKVLGLASPTPEEIERSERRGDEDEVMVSGSLGRRGVGYSTPPSAGSAPQMADLNGEMEMVEVEGCRPDDDDVENSQGILDFQSSQPRAIHSSSILAGRAV